jgi:hypothetical protein
MSAACFAGLAPAICIGRVSIVSCGEVTQQAVEITLIERCDSQGCQSVAGVSLAVCASVGFEEAAGYQFIESVVPIIDHRLFGKTH